MRRIALYALAIAAVGLALIYGLGYGNPILFKLGLTTIRITPETQPSGLPTKALKAGQAWMLRWSRGSMGRDRRIEVHSDGQVRYWIDVPNLESPPVYFTLPQSAVEKLRDSLIRERFFGLPRGSRETRVCDDVMTFLNVEVGLYSKTTFVYGEQLKPIERLSTLIKTVIIEPNRQLIEQQIGISDWWSKKVEVRGNPRAALETGAPWNLLWFGQGDMDHWEIHMSWDGRCCLKYPDPSIYVSRNFTVPTETLAQLRALLIEWEVILKNYPQVDESDDSFHPEDFTYPLQVWVGPYRSAVDSKALKTHKAAIEDFIYQRVLLPNRAAIEATEPVPAWVWQRQEPATQPQ